MLPVYVCPMHVDVRSHGAGKCPHCKMDLVPEGAALAIVRHMLGNPLHLAGMVAVMLAVIVGLIMLLHR